MCGEGLWRAHTWSVTCPRPPLPFIDVAVSFLCPEPPKSWGTPRECEMALGTLFVCLCPAAPGEWAGGPQAREGVVSSTDGHPAGQKGTGDMVEKKTANREMCWCGARWPCPPSRAPLPAVARGCSRLGAAELCLSLPPQLRSQAQEVGGNVTAAPSPPPPSSTATLLHLAPEGGSRAHRGPLSGKRLSLGAWAGITGLPLWRR